MALADLIMLKSEENPTGEFEIFDQNSTWKKKTLDNYYTKELQVKVFENGRKVYDSPSVVEIAEHCKKELNGFWSEIKRFRNPQKYYVDLSKGLYDLKMEMLHR